jgi:hypothetical protein
VKAGQVRNALKAYFPHPEYGIAFEVASATGFAANRRLDAVVMSLWPSRGLHLYGVKVARSDWRREKSNPAKAEELARFCHHFYLAAPANIVPASEVPPNWGLLEVDDGGRVHQTKAATLLKPEPPGYEFLAAVFRSIRREADPEMVDAALQSEREKLRVEHVERVEREVAARRERNEPDALAFRELIALLGVESVRGWFDRPGIIEAVRAVHKARIAGSLGRLRLLKGTLDATLRDIDAALEEFGIPDPIEEAKRAA